MKIDNSQLSPVENVSYLGVVLDEFLSWDTRANILYKNLVLRLIVFCPNNVIGIIKFFYNFSRNELASSVYNQFNLVHKVDTRNTRSHSLIYIPNSLPLDMLITPCTVMVLLYGINSSKIFFKAMIWLIWRLNLKLILMKLFLKNYENEL